MSGRWLRDRLAPALAGLAAAAALLALAGGGDPLAALRALDHGDLLLGDARLFFLPQGRAVLASAPGAHLHVAQSYLTPGAALAFAPLAALPDGGIAVLWVAVGLAVVALASLAARFAGCREPRSRAAIAFAVGCSAPVLHGLKWAPTSTWALLALAGAALALEGGRARRAALLVGVAIVAKPWAVLAIPALPGSRARLTALATAAALGLALPALVLGPTATWSYCADLVADVGARRANFAVDPNSQALGHVLARYLRVPAADRLAWSGALALPAALLAIGWLAVLARRPVARPRAATLWPLLAIPALVPTAWPHDLQVVALLLPAAFVARRGRAARSALAVAWAAQSVGAVWLGGPRWFGALGLPLAAVAIVAAVRVAAARRDHPAAGSATCTSASP
ncbi:MAG: DUF2029 domain-containing protein [Planctomycetes bacterium]|nr:DUF2029 domain-containing protein [Planctomycetota bacterium]